MANSAPSVVIVSAARTAVGSFAGAFNSMPASALGSLALKAAMERAKLEPGDVSPPISTKYGFHLLKLQERQKQGLRPLEDVRAEILSGLQQQGYSSALGDYLKGLQEKAFIKVYPTPEGAKAYELPATYIDG